MTFRFQLFLAAVITCALLGLVYAIVLWPIILMAMGAGIAVVVIFLIALMAIQNVAS